MMTSFSVSITLQKGDQIIFDLDVPKGTSKYQFLDYVIDQLSPEEREVLVKITTNLCSRDPEVEQWFSSCQGEFCF